MREVIFDMQRQRDAEYQKYEEERLRKIQEDESLAQERQRQAEMIDQVREFVAADFYQVFLRFHI